MNPIIETEQIKSRIKATFHTVSNAYDSPEMRSFPFAAEHMINLVKPAAGQRVLDIAAGTGMVAYH
jgi:ubiquinone/menaquinone biosynthesis C-methylase UbiE